MTRLWDSMYVAWLAWCTVAYASGRIAPSVTAHVATPLAAVLAAVAGVLLGWQAWSQHGTAALQRHWLPPRAWSSSTWAGIVAGVLWLAVQALDVVEGSVRGVFGMYVVLALIIGFVPRMLTSTAGQAAPAPPA